MTPRAQERSAFCTRRGLYHFKRMHFGLSNAPATFCRLMHRVLRDHLWRICLCYLDDVIVYATSKQELLERLHTIFSCLYNVGLKVKPSKCSLSLNCASLSWATWSPPRALTPRKRKLSRSRTGQCPSVSAMSVLSLALLHIIVNSLKILPASRNHFLSLIHI